MIQKGRDENTGQPQSAIARFEFDRTGDVHLTVLCDLPSAMDVELDEFFSEVRALSTVKS